MDTLLRDLRFALRSLRRSPSFALVVIVTIAIAIGATTTMMTIVNAAIVRPLPFPDAERLVFARGFVGREQAPRGLSYLEAMDWRAMNRAFDALAAYGETSLNINDVGEEPLHASAEIVSANFFQVLGVGAERGRTFLPEEDRTPDAAPVAVISHTLWQSRFGGIEPIVGRSITVNGKPFTIVGIMPPDFRGLSFDADIWIPMMMISAIRPVSSLEDRSNRWLGVVGRMKAGRSVADAQHDLDRVAATLESTYPTTNTDRGALVTPLRAYYLGSTQTLLLALFGAVGFLLLIACANVMSLQLVRAAARRREIALRVSLGAGRRRLVRQLLTEGIVLASIGGAGGVLLALWGIHALLALAPPNLLPEYAGVTIDARVLAWTALVTAMAGIAFGLAPALGRSRVSLVTALKDGAPSAASGFGSGRRLHAQQLFVMSEVGLALVLLAGAMLMVQSLRRQLGVDPGFRPDGVIAARLTLPLDRYDDAGRTRFVDQLVDGMRTRPGVAAVAAGANVPLRGLASGGHLMYDGGPSDGVTYQRHRVTPDYFATLGIQLRRGRVFTPADGPNAPHVAVVSAATARRLWPDRDPVGERISLLGTNGPLPPIEVVGVVDDVRFRNLTGDLSAPLEMVDVYFPFAQETDETIDIVVRSDADAAALTATLRHTVNELDPTLPLFEVAPLSDALSRQTSAARFGSLILSLFAAIAVVLAAVGIYGLLAFLVGTNRRDIALRMALGATSTRVIGSVVREGMLLAGLGGVVGILIAVPSTRVLTRFLYGVRASDPATLVAVTLLLLAVSLLASWFPARRASRVAPHAVLKGE